jgi:hypothetical protein
VLADAWVEPYQNMIRESLAQWKFEPPDATVCPRRNRRSLTTLLTTDNERLMVSLVIIGLRLLIPSDIQKSIKSSNGL